MGEWYPGRKEGSLENNYNKAKTWLLWEEKPGESWEVGLSRMGNCMELF